MKKYFKYIVILLSFLFIFLVSCGNAEKKIVPTWLQGMWFNYSEDENTNEFLIFTDSSMLILSVDNLEDMFEFIKYYDDKNREISGNATFVDFDGLKIYGLDRTDGKFKIVNDFHVSYSSNKNVFTMRQSRDDNLELPKYLELNKDNVISEFIDQAD